MLYVPVILKPPINLFKRGYLSVIYFDIMLNPKDIKTQHLFYMSFVRIWYV